jgi:SIR2-like domain
MEEPEAIYSRLRSLYEEQNYQPNELHRFFAKLPELLRRKYGQLSCPVMVTTNYDTLLEEAFEETSEPYNLLVYKKDENERYNFYYRHFGETEYQIITGDSLPELELGKKVVILKLHRGLDQLNPMQESWIVTEDDFINMARSKIAGLLPNNVLTRIRSSHLWFLGYSMQDWSLRVMLWDLWNRQNGYQWKNFYNSAIEPMADEDEFTRRFWEKWDVKVIAATLETYLPALHQRLESLPDREDWGL